MTLRLSTIVTGYGIFLGYHSHFQMQSNIWALEEDERSEYDNCLLTEHENKIFFFLRKYNVYFPWVALSFKKE